MNKVLTFTAITASLCLFTSCKKNVTPPIEPLITTVDMQLNGYKQTFVKDSSGYFNLTASQCYIGLRLRGSFLQETENNVRDTTIPDTSKGFYSRIKFTAPDTLVEEYNSLVADQPMESTISSQIKFTKGTTADVSQGKSVDLEYSQQAIEEHKAMYSLQLEREYTPIVTDMMWKEIERVSAKRFTADEAHNRYRLTIMNKTKPMEMGKALINIKGDTLTIVHASRLYFIMKFTGQVDVLK